MFNNCEEEFVDMDPREFIIRNIESGLSYKDKRILELEDRVRELEEKIRKNGIDV